MGPWSFSPPRDRSDAIGLTITPYRPNDAWLLYHQYVTAAWLSLLDFEPRRLANAIGDTATLRAPPAALSAAALADDAYIPAARLDDALLTLAGSGLIGYDPAQRMIYTSAAVPSLPEHLYRRLDEHHRAVVDEWDPYRLTLPVGQPSGFYVAPRLRMGCERWPMRTGVFTERWSTVLPRHAVMLAVELAAHRAPATEPFPLEGTVRRLGITPRRGVAELHCLAEHGLIALDRATRTITTCGYAPDPEHRRQPVELTASATSRRLLTRRHRLSPVRAPGLDL